MRKIHWNTIVMILFSVVIVVVSILGKDLLLQQTEGKLLNRKGEISMEAPVAGWQLETEAEPEVSDGNTNRNSQLTIDQVQGALNNWYSRQYEIIHDPVEGQLSIEEAIKNATDWMSVMRGKLQIAEEEKTVYSVNAVLKVGVREMDQKEPLQAYHSFWTVRLAGKHIAANLLVNAVTGEVWAAELVLYMTDTLEYGTGNAQCTGWNEMSTTDTSECRQQSLFAFVEQIGVWEAGDKVELLTEKDNTFLRGENGAVARMQCVQTQSPDLYYYEYNGYVVEKAEYIKIVYKFGFEE